MTKPTPESPPATPDQGSDDGGHGQAGAPQTAEKIRRGVVSQRKHIQELDGEDPLRGGVAD
jgi:hypothetical protein